MNSLVKIANHYGLKCERQSRRAFIFPAKMQSLKINRTVVCGLYQWCTIPGTSWFRFRLRFQENSKVWFQFRFQQEVHRLHSDSSPKTLIRMWSDLKFLIPIPRLNSLILIPVPIPAPFEISDSDSDSSKNRASCITGLYIVFVVNSIIGLLERTGLYCSYINTQSSYTTQLGPLLW